MNELAFIARLRSVQPLLKLAAVWLLGLSLGGCGLFAGTNAETATTPTMLPFTPVPTFTATAMPAVPATEPAEPPPQPRRQHR